MKNTKIEWTDHTWNGWIGCTKVSPGCGHCYADTLDLNRFSKTIGGGTKENPIRHWGKGAPRYRTSASNWKQPIKWNYNMVCDTCGRFFEQIEGSQKLCIPIVGDRCKQFTSSLEDIDPLTSTVESLEKALEERTCKGRYRRPRVFCSSLADWLDDEVPIEWLKDLLCLIEKTPNLTWQLLTKRPENFRKRVSEVAEKWGISCEIAVWWAQRNFAPENILLGTTVENNEVAIPRIVSLLNIPAKGRFLSCEPLLGPLDLTTWLPNPEADQDTTAFHNHCHPEDSIHWVICGGESGPKARWMNPQWARSIRDQCFAANVPFFFKQWGEWIPWEFDEQQFNHVLYSQHDMELWNDDAPRDPLNMPKGWEWDESDFLFQKVGKKVAGRLLDGHEHSEFPKIS
jgi:protein gp37